MLNTKGAIAALTVSLWATLFSKTEATMPTGIVTVEMDDPSAQGLTTVQPMLASMGSFGKYPPMNPNDGFVSLGRFNPEQPNAHLAPILPPDDDPFFCNFNNYPGSGSPVPAGSVYLVPRGVCAFERKALAAQNMGAAAIVIYGTLASRYALNETTGHVINPQRFYDYDCNMTSAQIPMESLSFNDPPYDYKVNDARLSGSQQEGNLCAVENDFQQRCPSSKCLLTGEVDENTVEACCAWDLHVWLYSDSSLHDDEHVDNPSNEKVAIPSLFITMAQGDEILHKMQYGQNVKLSVYTRYYPKYNPSTVIIWALGVFVAALASYLSASEYRDAKNDLIQRHRHLQNENSDDFNDDDNVRRSASGYERVGGSASAHMPPEDTLELTAWHAIGFIFFSTAGLLTLFFLKIYAIVKVFYAFGCSGAIMQVIVMPFYMKVANKMASRSSSPTSSPTRATTTTSWLYQTAFTTDFAELGAVSYIQLLSAVTSYGIGGVWLFIAFTQRHPDENLFFWVMQDVMGACMCIMFLTVMKVNSIQVASVLLTAAFFYDIFFVFVTPYLTKGGKSIMVDVATSGGPPEADPSWCEKYPDGPECQGGDPLPMLLTIPRLGDYAGGSSLLGLGDIVLPGLLLSFAARYDEAKRLVAAFHSPSNDRRRHGRVDETCGTSQRGYFGPVVVAYGVGLSMANVAVYVMRMGQPALLYLVPCCLGTIVFLGWKRKELNDLWNTPKVLISCDNILYGNEEGVEEQETNSETGDHSLTLDITTKE